MACSRTPKWRLRPPGSSAEKAGSPLIRVLFDGARSAEPPTSSGSVLASALSTSPEACARGHARRPRARSVGRASSPARRAARRRAGARGRPPASGCASRVALEQLAPSAALLGALGRARASRTARAPPRAPGRSARAASRGPSWWPRPPRRRAARRGPRRCPASWGCRSRSCVRTATSDGRSVSASAAVDRRVERREVVAVLDPQHVPAVGLVARGDVLGEGEVGRAVDGDAVVVVEDVELCRAAGGRRASSPRRRRPPSGRRRWRTPRCGGRRAGSRAVEARGEQRARRSPCRPRCRGPGRAARWWSRRPRSGRARDGPASSSRAGGSAAAPPSAGRSRRGGAARRAAPRRGRRRARSGRGSGQSGSAGSWRR